MLPNWFSDDMYFLLIIIIFIILKFVGFVFVRIIYDFCIKTMFCSSLPPVVCMRSHILFTLFVFVCI